MRYGMNPHQSATLVSGGPTALNGEPSYINYLDALNASALVREADAATGRPAAASFKHVSPAGAALAGDLDDAALETWGLSEPITSPILSAYVRARDADPKSSFGDVVALSRSVDVETAEFLRGVICDALIAPSYEAAALEILRKKRGGKFLIFESDENRATPRRERRDILGATLEQDVDDVDVVGALPAAAELSPATRDDALLGMVTARYTQSNSVVLVRDGATVGVGAGQQNRVDCVRLAGGKSAIWWLRRHELVRALPRVDGMRRQDRLNWQIRFAGHEMTRSQLGTFTELFGEDAAASYSDHGWRDDWSRQFGAVTLVSDGYLPFRDNIEFADEYGVSTVVEPGGSSRTDEIAEATAEFGMTHVQTGLRLFHH